MLNNSGDQLFSDPMTTLLKYKDYSGSLDVDTEANILFGTVLDINDVITFQGETIEEARQAFQDSVEDYLEFCAELGRAPEKPFSGKIHAKFYWRLLKSRKPN